MKLLFTLVHASIDLLYYSVYYVCAGVIDGDDVYKFPEQRAIALKCEVKLDRRTATEMVCHLTTVLTVTGI